MPEPEPEPEPEESGADALTEAECKKMKVAELKDALKERGLATDGLKKVLLERLLKAI